MQVFIHQCPGRHVSHKSCFIKGWKLACCVSITAHKPPVSHVTGWTIFHCRLKPDVSVILLSVKEIWDRIFTFFNGLTVDRIRPQRFVPHWVKTQTHTAHNKQTCLKRDERSVWIWQCELLVVETELINSHGLLCGCIVGDYSSVK